MEVFFAGDPIENLFQPTASGEVESARFGCVRNNGRRFHEAIDIRPLTRDRRGEAADQVFAFLPGRVVYINKSLGRSSYGRYVVLEHTDQDIAVYSLYAHLARIDVRLQAGEWVGGGERIGTMGRSAGGYSIPKSRAHLHFEIGVRKSQTFDDWYDWKAFTEPNYHGNYNGLNLLGMDPEDFFIKVRQGEFKNFAAYIRSLPTAYTLRVATRRVPDYIVRYPGLLTRSVQPEHIVGWEVDFTWYGLPKQWTPLLKEDITTQTAGSVALVGYDKNAFAGHCRDTLLFRSSEVLFGKALKDDIQLLFGFR